MICHIFGTKKYSQSHLEVSKRIAFSQSSIPPIHVLLHHPNLKINYIKQDNAHQKRKKKYIYISNQFDHKINHFL